MQENSPFRKCLSTNNLIRNLRYELWANAIHFSGFTIKNITCTKSEKRKPNPESVLFYAIKSA